ncbi:MAG: hypothetical protein EOO38_04030 [Cytophagaceae bacterium]|nr:MAG: hypothetical protein EOO38_04030 [Cytophagaceae bacterium]
MNKGVSGPLRTQEGPTVAEDAQAARTLEALKNMGFDAKAPRVQRPATILAIDLSPLFKGNPRLPETSVNAFSVYEISGRSKLECPKGSKIAYKPQEWATTTSFKAPEHATEVIGVMAAKQVPSSQVFGALSSVISSGNVHALYVDDGKGEPDDQTTVDTIFELKPVAAFMAAGCSTTTFPVVNVSLKFSSLGRENASADYEGVLFGRASEAQYALFIVAAGNPENLKATRTKTSADCHHLPGCKALNTQNMVSVMGLDLSGELPSRSSLYGTPFEVAAIGDIWTIRRDGRERPVGGSSYATPFVTSLASLIVGKAYMLKVNGGMIQPPDVKTRILQTVDFLRDTSVVRFGRVNFSRAMEIGRDILVLDAALTTGGLVSAPYCNSSSHCYAGDIDKADSITLLEGYDGDGKKVEVKGLDFDRVLRLSRSGADKWDVVYLPPVRDSMIPMRLKNATLLGITHLTFVSNVGSSNRISISTVKDYTRCMWRKGSDGVCMKGA